MVRQLSIRAKLSINLHFYSHLCPGVFTLKCHSFTFATFGVATVVQPFVLFTKHTVFTKSDPDHKHNKHWPIINHEMLLLPSLYVLLSINLVKILLFNFQKNVFPSPEQALLLAASDLAFLFL